MHRSMGLESPESRTCLAFTRRGTEKSASQVLQLKTTKRYEKERDKAYEAPAYTRHLS
jgi:hypothetical protein